MTKSSFLKLSGLALAIATISSGTYAAQLEEVIVTAQKRAESLQDVPISMTALSGEKIEEAGINSLAELGAYVPNLSISENAVATGIYMRGVGPGAQQSFEQSVGLYVDGVHMAKGRQVRTGMFDLAQVEVLRGPQGILFGKNTLAGAINVTSASANIGDELGGKISVTKESDNGQTLEGHIAGSVTDTLAVRFAFKDRENDGYLHNSYANENSPSVDEDMWRLSATWEPNDTTSVKLKHMESSHIRGGSTIAINQFAPVANTGAADAIMYGVMLGGPFVAPGVQLFGSAFPGFLPAIAGGQDAYRDAKSFGGCALEASLGRSSSLCSNGGEKPEGTNTNTEDSSLNIDIELANGYTFTSVTGRAGYDYEDGIDADGLPVQFIGRSDISDYKQTSQEFRLASPTDGKFSYITGAYVENQKQTIDRVVAIDGTLGVPEFMAGTLLATRDPATGAVIGAGSPTFLAFNPTQVAGINFINSVLGTPTSYAAGTPGQTLWLSAGRVSNWEQDTDAWAVFFQGTYNLTEKLSLTAGVRYTEEDKSVTAYAKNTEGFTGIATPSAAPLLETLVGSLFGTYNHTFVDERSTDQFMPAVNLEWNQSDDSMFYISYSEGFKSGGFNSVDDQKPVLATNAFGQAYVPDRTAPGAGWAYEDETATSLEIGGKHTLLDGAMNFNWAIFNSEYVDQQVSTFVGLGFVVANAATSNIDGVELDLTWQASDNLTLGANVAYLDGSYGSFPGAGCTAEQSSGVIGLGTLTPDSAVISYDGCTQQFSGGVPTGVSQDLAGGQIGAEYSGAMFADYRRPLSNGVVWFASVDLNFTDGFFMTGDLDPVDYQEGFEKINIRTGLRGENWDLMLFGRNITDELTASGAADVPLASGSHWRYMSAGEVWGARFSYSF
ncbi:TonB-dependent receptor [Porticoccaceae bacterium]|nr:TonB-dependent receptor [Porticoccaceae bacterium]